MLEDSLEDANRQVDEAKREREKALVEADEALFSRREAETARDQLQEALYRLGRCRAGTRDGSARFPPETEQRSQSAWPVCRDKSLATSLVGAIVVLLALEAASVLGGHGELFSMLLGLAGQ